MLSKTTHIFNARRLNDAYFGDDNNWPITVLINFVAHNHRRKVYRYTLFYTEANVHSATK